MTDGIWRPNERKLREAKKYIYSCVATLIDPRCGHENGFLNHTKDSDEATPEEVQYNQLAIETLVRELYKRSR